MVEAGGGAPVTAPSRFTTIGGAAADLARRFRAAGMDTPELDARLLVAHICNLSREAYILEAGRTLSAAESASIEACAARRLAYEPVSRIIGKREFYGRDFTISPAVLDPRPDTETLVDAALALVKHTDAGVRSPRILDLGVGSGCILLTLLAELPDAWGVGIDIDPAALEIAQKNALALGLSERSAFACMDWTTALSGQFDLILSNPPYIASSEIASLASEVRLYDPLMALDGAADGLSAYRKLARGCRNLLRPGGWMLVEAGREQAREIIGLLEETGWIEDKTQPECYRDLAGVNRVVAIKRQASR